MENMSLQSLVSAISPPEGEALGGYLEAVSRALGVSSDAALARVMGLPSSTIANWRRRGVVSKDGLGWFARDMLKVVARKHDYPFQPGSGEVNAVMELLRNTRVDPLEAGASANILTGEAVPPLLALASIIWAGPRSADLDELLPFGADAEVARLLSAALPELRKVIAPGAKGPQ